MQQPTSKKAATENSSYGSQAQTKSAPDTKRPISIKSNFPRRKFLWSVSLLLIGIVLTYLVTSLASPNPTPFDSKFDLLSFKSWVQPIERNGIYRVSLVDTASSISQYAVIGEQLALKFTNGGGCSITPLGVISHLSQEQGETFSSAQNIRFSNGNGDLDDATKRDIEQLLNSLPDNADLIKILLSSYSSGSANRVLEPVKSEAQYSKQQYQQQQQQQQVAYSLPPTDPINPVTTVKKYIENTITNVQIEVVSYGVERHYLNGWKMGAGNTSGVLVEIDYQIRAVNWQNASEDMPNITVATSQDSADITNWEIVNGQLFNRIDRQNNRHTVAALATAFNAADPDVIKISAARPSQLEKTVLPSPQIYPSALSIIILIGFSFLSLRALGSNDKDDDLDVVNEQKIIDNFISDAPANDKSQDKLGFVEISQALSSFLRNIGTKAPLTIAISGVWGSGKSSLMYFLKQNLETYRIRPVWINAWHHQNEAQFLAGLLSAVQAHAIPEIWTSAGLLYRWNLFKMRCSESPLVYVIASLFFFGSMSYWLTLQDLNFHVIQESTDEDRWQNITVLLTTLMGGVPLILASMNNLSSMVGSNNPLKMLLGSPGNSLDLRSNVGLRQKFAKEFHMLCRALGDTTLTIFIDDLDRCKESRIMDVMETLNYLVCSGDCYIILGIEREPIEKAIINYYRNTHQDLSNEELQQKARRYLEKIINIEIPVPTAKSSQVSSLIVSDEHPTSLTTKKWKWLAPVLFFAALLSSIILGSYFAGVISISTTNQTQPSSVAAPKVQGGPALETVEAEPIVHGASSSNTPTWTFEKPQPEYQFINVILPFLFVGLIALIIRLERYKQHKHIVEQDSAPFIAAIAVWAKALGTSSHTPRSIKRYVNRARYLAMRNIASNTHIKEENLVTLAALLEFADQNDFTGIDNLQRFIPSFEDETLAREVDDLLTKSANITEQRKQQFLHWVKGIQVN